MGNRFLTPRAVRLQLRFAPKGCVRLGFRSGSGVGNFEGNLNPHPLPSQKEDALFGKHLRGTRLRERELLKSLGGLEQGTRDFPRRRPREQSRITAVAPGGQARGGAGVPGVGWGGVGEITLQAVLGEFEALAAGSPASACGPDGGGGYRGPQGALRLQTW